MAVAYITQFRVYPVDAGKDFKSPRTKFPVDMLRYDSCYPRSLEDAIKVGVPAREYWGVTLESVHAGKPRKDYPTAPRWATFGWLVVPKSVKTRKV